MNIKEICKICDGVSSYNPTRSSHNSVLSQRVYLANKKNRRIPNRVADSYAFSRKKADSISPNYKYINLKRVLRDFPKFSWVRDFVKSDDDFSDVPVFSIKNEKVVPYTGGDIYIPEDFIKSSWDEDDPHDSLIDSVWVDDIEYRQFFFVFKDKKRKTKDSLEDDFTSEEDGIVSEEDDFTSEEDEPVKQSMTVHSEEDDNHESQIIEGDVTALDESAFYQKLVDLATKFLVQEDLEARDELDELLSCLLKFEYRDLFDKILSKMILTKSEWDEVSKDFNSVCDSLKVVRLPLYKLTKIKDDDLDELVKQLETDESNNDESNPDEGNDGGEGGDSNNDEPNPDEGNDGGESNVDEPNPDEGNDGGEGDESNPLQDVVNALDEFLKSGDVRSLVGLLHVKDDESTEEIPLKIDKESYQKLLEQLKEKLKEKGLEVPDSQEGADSIPDLSNISLPSEVISTDDFEKIRAVDFENTINSASHDSVPEAFDEATAENGVVELSCTGGSKDRWFIPKGTEQDFLNMPFDEKLKFLILKGVCQSDFIKSALKLGKLSCLDKSLTKDKLTDKFYVVRTGESTLVPGAEKVSTEEWEPDLNTTQVCGCQLYYK